MVHRCSMVMPVVVGATFARCCLIETCLMQLLRCQRISSMVQTLAPICGYLTTNDQWNATTKCFLLMLHIQNILHYYGKILARSVLISVMMVQRTFLIFIETMILAVEILYMTRLVK